MPSRKPQSLTPGVFEALRRDASLTIEGEVPVDVRPEWVWAAQILTRLSQEPSARGLRRRYLTATAQLMPAKFDEAGAASRALTELLAALRERVSRRTATRIAAAAARLIDDADLHGATAISNVIATAAVIVCKDARSAAVAELLWRAGRARRKAGDLVMAASYYRRTKLLGQRHGDHRAIARGALGLGVIARERGNVDTMVRLFKLAHLHALRSKSLELQIQSHQGMQIAHGILGDHAGEIRHVWLAYSLGTGDPAHDLEALHNVAWFACQAGIAAEALAALLAILRSRPMSPALRLHFLGTTANAAAQCGRRDVVEQVREELDHFQNVAGYPYESGTALISLGEALEWLGNTSLARQYRNRARTLATRFGLNELLQRSITPKVRAPVTTADDPETASELEELRRVLRTIAAGVVGSSATTHSARASNAPLGGST